MSGRWYRLIDVCVCAFSLIADTVLRLSVLLSAICVGYVILFVRGAHPTSEVVQSLCWGALGGLIPATLCISVQWMMDICNRRGAKSERQRRSDLKLGGEHRVVVQDPVCAQVAPLRRLSAGDDLVEKVYWHSQRAQVYGAACLFGLTHILPYVGSGIMTLLMDWRQRQQHFQQLPHPPRL